jgi:murein DD-endopeptidase MepM/ murein hydrolase activator NlpD
MADFWRFPATVLTLAISLPILLAQDRNSSRDDRITARRLGLPADNTRTSEPFVTRIYKTDDNDQILKKQPEGYPFTIKQDYTLRANETAKVHEGVDISSRPANAQQPIPLEFKAGVHGVVVRAGGGDWGTIAVQVQDGSVLQYMHTSASHVKLGDIVAPDTVLGVTGRTGAATIHLHIQAKDEFGNAISPDLSFRAGQKRLATPLKPDKDAGADFDPDQWLGIEPQIVNGVVKFPVEQKTKWLAEVIGEGGRIDLVLGEFPTYRDAAYCSHQWDQAHPKDLRLTREREVATKSGRGRSR